MTIYRPIPIWPIIYRVPAITVFSTLCCRYITALTDSDEDQSDEDRKPVKEPVDELTALLQKADRIHSCNGTEKAQGLDLLLEKKDEVCAVTSAPSIQAVFNK